MHIVLDARLYGTAHRGLGRYVSELAHGLVQTINSSDNLTLLVDPTGSAWAEHWPPNVALCPAPWRVYSLAEQLRLPRMLKKLNPDLVHIPHFNVPLLCPSPFVVTVHDLILHHFPNRRASRLPLIYYWLKVAVYRLVYRVTVSRSSAIITVSKATANDLLRCYPAAAGKVSVVPLAPSLTSFSAGAAGSKMKPYVLTVGAAYPHKNLERAAQAVVYAARKVPNLTYLVVGKKDYFMGRFDDYLKQHQFGDRVRCCGEVTDAELARLYAGAACYLAPSHIEGVGLGPLDALQYGLPVVAADIPAFREFLGSRAHYVDEYSVSDMASGIVKLACPPEPGAERLIPAGDGIGAYSWKNVARDTCALYGAVTKGLT